MEKQEQKEQELKAAAAAVASAKREKEARAAAVAAAEGKRGGEGKRDGGDDDEQQRRKRHRYGRQVFRNACMRALVSSVLLLEYFSCVPGSMHWVVREVRQIYPARYVDNGKGTIR